jgi:hypothetical protein
LTSVKGLLPHKAINSLVTLFDYTVLKARALITITIKEIIMRNLKFASLAALAVLSLGAISAEAATYTVTVEAPKAHIAVRGMQAPEAGLAAERGEWRVIQFSAPDTANNKAIIAAMQAAIQNAIVSREPNNGWIVNIEGTPAELTNVSSIASALKSGKKVVIHPKS